MRNHLSKGHKKQNIPRENNKKKKGPEKPQHKTPSVEMSFFFFFFPLLDQGVSPEQSLHSRHIPELLESQGLQQKLSNYFKLTYLNKQRDLW